MYSPISLLLTNLYLRFGFQGMHVGSVSRTRGEEVGERERKGKNANEECINERATAVGSGAQILLGIL